jgi:deoxyhypusine synthase
LQQAQNAMDVIKAPARSGHKYAIQIGTEIIPTGGRSGLVTNDEAFIYGKLMRGASTSYINCDPTIALPILITALSQTGAKYMKGRKRPNFTLARELTVEIP